MMNKDKCESMNNIEVSMTAFNASSDEEKTDRLLELLESIRMAMNDQEMFTVPVELPPDAIEMIDPDHAEVGDTISINKELHFRMLSVHMSDGEEALAAFTSQEEADKGADVSTVPVTIEHFLHNALMNSEMEGIVINPWDHDFYLSKELIKLIFNANLPKPVKNKITFAARDITKAETACIVNAANESLLGGGGVDGAIHRAAGPALLEECRTLHGCETCEAKLTKGYDLHADYIIHTVGPKYTGCPQGAVLLRNCYWNSLELARKNDIHSISFPAISTGIYGYPLKEAAEIALKTVSDWLEINPNYGMEVLFACFDDKTTDLYRSVWDKNHEVWQQRPIIRENNGLLEKAIQFALEAHKGSVRKGTDRPYVLHPLETLQILSSMNADTNLMIAGVLHDTLEDTDTSLLEIYDRFGMDVAALVSSHTEDKRKVWYTRKLITINNLPNEGTRQKMLVLADKVSNLRDMLRDYKRIGDELWGRFRAPKELQVWYYSEIINGLCEMMDDPESSDVYWEMNALYKDLFVTFLLDENKGMLYQVGNDGDIAALKKGKPQWNPFQGKIPEEAHPLSRKKAEHIEDNWAEPFWAVHELDLSDVSYDLFHSENRSLSINISNGKLTFNVEDFGEHCKSINGKREYEFYYSLNTDSTHRFLAQLRLKHGIRNKLSTIFKNKFGKDDDSVRFKDFCDEIGVDAQFFSI